MLRVRNKVKKTHRILKCKQKDWMNPYIDFNTERRKESTNEKTMENTRKRIKIRTVKNSQGFIKYTSRPTCVNWKVFENNLAVIHENIINLKQTHICSIK